MSGIPFDLNISTLHIDAIDVSNININSDEFTQIHLQIENVALFMNIIMILQTCIMLIIVCLVSEIRKKIKNNINLLE